jgi:hypothetical protein
MASCSQATTGMFYETNVISSGLKVHNMRNAVQSAASAQAWLAVCHQTTKNDEYNTETFSLLQSIKAPTVFTESCLTIAPIMYQEIYC